MQFGGRGEVSIQALMIVPVTFSLLLLGVHFVQLAHGGHVAIAAANRGAQVASAGDGNETSIGATVGAVEEVVRDLGGRLGTLPIIDISQATVTVAVEVVFDGAVPFLPDRVRRSVTVPRERFLRDDER